MKLPLLNVWVRGMFAALLVGTAGAWNGPTVLILAVVSGGMFFDLGRRDRVERVDPDAFEPDPFGLAMQYAFLVVLAAGAWDNRAPEIAWRHPGLLGVAGSTVIMAGVGLRQSARRALGRQFTVGLSVFADHELIVDGPYRWIRHPNYAGLLLIGLGTALMVRSPLAVGVMMVGWLPLALLRIRAEERSLHAQLGAAYTDYSRGRWCLVPGVY